MDSHTIDNQWEKAKGEVDRILHERKIQRAKYRNGELQRHEILHFLRGNLESDHREVTTNRARLSTFCVTTTNLDLPATDFYRNGPCTPRCEYDRMKQFCNTSVPVYLLATPQKPGGGVTGVLRLALSSFIYRKWFQPYKTEIEFDRSLVEFIRPIDMQCTDIRPPASVFDTLRSLNRAICTRVEEMRKAAICKAYEDLKAPEGMELAGTQATKDEAIKLAKIRREELSIRLEGAEKCYSIQHLFRAILLVVCGHNYNREGSSAIGKMPVFIALTGEQEGLSEPITFDPIRDKVEAIINRGPCMVVQTTLETAAKFLVDLERREIAAVGLRPNPPPEIRSRVLRQEDHQYRECSPFFEELGSSSHWVDTNIYTEWTGGGKDGDVYDAEAQEEFQRKLWAPRK